MVEVWFRNGLTVRFYSVDYWDLSPVHLRVRVGRERFLFLTRDILGYEINYGRIHRKRMF